MPKKIVIFVFFLLCIPLFCLAEPEQPAEDLVTIITSYPSPYGVYDEMRTNKMVVGDTNASSAPASDTEGLLKFKVLSSDPTGADDARAGTIYYNSTDNKFKYYDGQKWQTLG